MPTKTEYREYISGPEWQVRRREFLVLHGYACDKCALPRWLAIIAYDQDLHVHHVSYANVGAERDEDLKALCRRCHEIETFGSSVLHRPQRHACQICGRPSYDHCSRICGQCLAYQCCAEESQLLAESKDGTVWKNLIREIWHVLYIKAFRETPRMKTPRDLLVKSLQDATNATLDEIANEEHLTEIQVMEMLRKNGFTDR